MKTYLRHRAARLALALTSIISASAIGTVLTSSPASATTGTFSGGTLTLSNSAETVNAGAVNAGTYTWSFTTPSASSTYHYLTFTVPSTTTLTATASGDAQVYGFTGCTWTTPTSPTSGTVRLSFSSACTVSASTPVEVAIQTINSGNVPSTFLQSTITGDNGDSGTATVYNPPDNNTTSVDVVVPESLTLTGNATSITLFPTPLTAPTAAVDMTVSTNASNGYTLSACTDPLPTYTSTQGTVSTISALGSSNNGTNPDTNMPTDSTAFGAEPSIGTGSSTNAALGSSFNGGGYYAYSSTCSTASPVFRDTGPTSGDKLQFLNSATIAPTQPAGDYKGTIDYLVTPTY